MPLAPDVVTWRTCLRYDARQGAPAIDDSIRAGFGKE